MPILRRVLRTALLATLPCTAVAAEIPKELLEANVQRCVEAAKAKEDPSAPKRERAIPAYCKCVVGKYWQAVPQADFDALVAEKQAGTADGPAAQAMADNQDARANAASAACKNPKP